MACKCACVRVRACACVCVHARGNVRMGLRVRTATATAGEHSHGGATRQGRARQKHVQLALPQAHVRLSLAQAHGQLSSAQAHVHSRQRQSWHQHSHILIPCPCCSGREGHRRWQSPLTSSVEDSKMLAAPLPKGARRPAAGCLPSEPPMGPRSRVLRAHAPWHVQGAGKGKTLESAWACTWSSVGVTPGSVA